MTPLPQAIQAALLDCGAAHTARQAAALLGIHPVQWSEYMTGKRSPTQARVERGLQRLVDGGLDVRASWTPADGWTVRVWR